MPDEENPPIMPKRAAAALAKRRAEEEQKTLTLPWWPDPVMGVPNELIRCAVFAAIDDRNRKYKRREPIACQGETKVSFTGEQLTQAHLDVFEGIMHMSRGENEGNDIKFSANSLLKLIGRHTGKCEHDWLYGMILDLGSSILLIEKDNGKFFFGAMLSCGAGDFNRSNYSIKVSSDLIRLFQRGFSTVQWAQRRMLKRKPLACWLQMYYSSHAKPLPVGVDFLRKSCGSKTEELRFFRRNLKTALDEIKAVGVIGSWEIDENDKVVVERLSILPPSGAA